MPRKKKDYIVTISYCEHTPEEAARLEKEITAELYGAKMISLKRQAEETVVHI